MRGDRQNHIRSSCTVTRFNTLKKQYRQIQFGEPEFSAFRVFQGVPKCSGVPVFLVLVQAALSRFRGMEVDLMGRRSHLLYLGGEGSSIPGCLQILDLQRLASLRHICQLSRIIRESPGYRTNLPVSRTGNHICRITPSLNLCTTVS